MLGDNLYTASSDSNIRVFNVHTGELLQTLLYHKRSVTCLEVQNTIVHVYTNYGYSDQPAGIHTCLLDRLEIHI